MLLFAILGIPLFTLWVLSIYSRQQNYERSLSPAPKLYPGKSFLQGLLYCLPVLILILLLRRIVPLSYRPFKLYLYYLIQDHLLPFLLVLALYLSVFREKKFIELLFFASGFYSLLTFSEIFLNYGRYELYNIVLLPVIRMGILLNFTLLFIRYKDWYGYRKILYLFLIMLIPLAGGLATYFYMRFQTLYAFLGSAVFFAGGIVFLLMDREH
ncbi:hypothetical protein ES703_54799 [subsurface metagenome]